MFKKKTTVIDGFDVLTILVMGIMGFVLTFGYMRHQQRVAPLDSQLSVKMLVLTPAKEGDTGEMRQAEQQFASSVVPTYVNILQDERTLLDTMGRHPKSFETIAKKLSVQNVGQIITISVPNKEVSKRDLMDFVVRFQNMTEKITGRDSVQILGKVQNVTLQPESSKFKEILMGGILGAGLGVVLSLIRSSVLYYKNK